MMIKICDAFEETDKLNEYSERFAAQDFKTALYDFYASSGRLGKLFKRSDEKFSKQTDPTLNDYLDSHDDLRWIHHLNSRNYADAIVDLIRLATNEKNSYSRKKTLLSMAKLAALADSSLKAGNSFVDGLNREIAVNKFQELLPEDVFQLEGFENPTEMPPLSSQDLIQRFISSSIPKPENFLHALKILKLVSKSFDEQKFNEIKQRIWTAAILADNWSEYSDADSACLNACFLKSIRLLNESRGIDSVIDDSAIRDLLPSMDELFKSDELRNFTEKIKKILGEGMEIILQSN